jgi:hypothetical protein
MTGTVLLMAIALAESTAAALPSPEPAWRGLVVVLVPSIDDDVTRNALARISGELAAAPFKTLTTPIDPDADVMSQVETAGNDRSATAAFAIVRDRDPGSSRVTIWVSNRITGTTTMQRMQVEGGNVDRAATKLAVESVELVRASLAELWPAPPAPAAAEAQTEKADKPAAAPRARLALSASVGLMSDFGDAPSSWAPQIAASYGRPDGVGVRLAASGLGPGAGVSSGTSSARIERAMLTLGLVRSFRPDRTIQPMFGIAAGVHRLSVHGMSPAAPQLARDPGAFSALATASAGVALALSARVAVLVEAQALMFWPTQTVRIVDTDVARYDRPSLFTLVGLLASF